MELNHHQSQLLASFLEQAFRPKNFILAIKHKILERMSDPNRVSGAQILTALIDRIRRTNATSIELSNTEILLISKLAQDSVVQLAIKGQPVEPVLNRILQQSKTIN